MRSCTCPLVVVLAFVAVIVLVSFCVLVVALVLALVLAPAGVHVRVCDEIFKPWSVIRGGGGMGRSPLDLKCMVVKQPRSSRRT